MPKRYLEILLAACTFGLLALVAWLLQFNGLYGQDSHEYLRFAGELRASLLSGSDLGSFFWPVYYPLTGALLSLMVPNLPLVMQGISMVALASGALFLARSLQILYPGHRPHVLIFTGLFFVLSPFIFRSGLVVMSEMLSVLFISGALYYWLRCRSKRQLKDLLFFLGFCCGAVLTRYNTLVILLPFIAYTGWDQLRNFKVKYLLWSTLLVALCILPQVVVHQSMSGSGLNHYLLREWSVSNFFRSEFNLADGHLQYTLPNVLYAFQYLVHPGFTLLGLPLLLFLKKKHFRNTALPVTALSVVLYTIFLMGIPYQNVRFMVPVFPLVLCLLYSGFLKVSNWLLQRHWLAYSAIVLFVLFQSLLINRAMNHVLALNRFERNLSDRLELRDPNLPIYTFSVDLALQTYGLQNPVRNFWYDDLVLPDSTVYVLFNEPLFKEQWAGKSVMINWERLNQAGQLEVLDELVDGWKLYKFTP